MIKLGEKQFKPNLVPKKSKSKTFDIHSVIRKNGGHGNYIINFHKNGVRMQVIEGQILTQDLTPVVSELVLKRLKPFAKVCQQLNIAIDGEFYLHGLDWGNINRFASVKDVTDPDYKKDLRQRFKKDPKGFKEEFNGLDINLLTTFHKDLKLHLFDGIVLNAREDEGYLERMLEIGRRLKPYMKELNETIVPPGLFCFKTKYEVEAFYQLALKNGYKGLILTHKDHKYKFGRSTLKDGMLLKM